MPASGRVAVGIERPRAGRSAGQPGGDGAAELGGAFDRRIAATGRCAATRLGQQRRRRMPGLADRQPMLSEPGRRRHVAEEGAQPVERIVGEMVEPRVEHRPPMLATLRPKRHCLPKRGTTLG